MQIYQLVYAGCTTVAWLCQFYTTADLKLTTASRARARARARVRRLIVVLTASRVSNDLDLQRKLVAYALNCQPQGAAPLGPALMAFRAIAVSTSGRAEPCCTAILRMRAWRCTCACREMPSRVAASAATVGLGR